MIAFSMFEMNSYARALKIPDYKPMERKSSPPQTREEMIDHIKNTVNKCRSMIKSVEGKDALFKRNPFNRFSQRTLWQKYKGLMLQMSYNDYLGHINDLKFISGKSQTKFISKIKNAKDFTKARNSVSEDLTVFAYNCKAPVDAIKGQIERRKALIAKKMHNK